MLYFALEIPVLYAPISIHKGVKPLIYFSDYFWGFISFASKKVWNDNWKEMQEVEKEQMANNFGWKTTNCLLLTEKKFNLYLKSEDEGKDYVHLSSPWWCQKYYVNYITEIL